MIKANELRIGNICSDGVISPVVIIDIMHNQVVCRYAQKTEHQGWFLLDYDTLQPIAITEETILNFGFERYSDELTIKLGHRFFLSFDLNVKLIFTENTDTADNSSVYHEHIKYVHQLQNLFYSLTGCELNTSVI